MGVSAGFGVRCCRPVVAAALGVLSVVAPTVLRMSTTTPSKESLKAARKAMWASRMQRAGDGWWSRLLALLMGAPSGAVFTVSVRAEQTALLIKAAGELGYAANEVSTTGGLVTMNLVWTETGYAPLSGRQRRDLTQGLRRAGIKAPVVIGPQAGVPPMREWWVLAARQEEAPALAAWFEDRGYSGGTISASTEHEARWMVERNWRPPFPWVVVCADDAAGVQLAEQTSMSWLPRTRLFALFGLGLIVAASASWLFHWPIMPPYRASVAPVDNAFTTYVYEALAVGIMQLAVIWSLVAPLRVGLPIRSSFQNERTAVSKGMKIRLYLLILAGGGAMGIVLVAVLRHYFLTVLIGSVFLATIVLIGRLLDPPDRRRKRLPVAIFGTLFASVVGWAALADLVLAGGLQVPFGVVRADLFTRAAVLVVVVLPPVVVLLIGGWVYRLMRRQDRVAAALLVLMTLCTSILIALSGFSFALTEAGRIVAHPGEGFWSLSISTQRVSGFATAEGVRLAPLRDGELYGVIGEVGDRVVLLSHPCGDGKSQVFVQQTGSLSFEPVDSQACDAVRAATATARTTP